jgi:hypothetical protein
VRSLLLSCALSPLAAGALLSPDVVPDGWDTGAPLSPDVPTRWFLGGFGPLAVGALLSPLPKGWGNVGAAVLIASSC